MFPFLKAMEYINFALLFSTFDKLGFLLWFFSMFPSVSFLKGSHKVSVAIYFDILELFKIKLDNLVRHLKKSYCLYR